MVIPHEGIKIPMTNGKPREDMSNKQLEKTRLPLNDYKCWHCDTEFGLTHHEIFHGTGKRRLSLIYQMVVMECQQCHHKIHHGDLEETELKEWGQEHFKRLYPHLDFLEIFSINYLDKE